MTRIHFDLLTDKYQGNSHSILINPEENRSLLSFLQRGREAYFSARDKGYAHLPTKFAARYVGETIPSSSETAERIHREHRSKGSTPHLGEFLDGGECREKNLLTHLLLAQLGYHSEILSGTVVFRRPDYHVWLYVPVTGEYADSIVGDAMPWRDYERKFQSWPNSSVVFARPHHDIWMLSPFAGGFQAGRGD